MSNRILSALPSEEYHRLLKNAQRLPVEVGHGLYDADEPIRDVFFILSGMGSVVTTMEDGTSIEVLVVGREGATGLASLVSATVPTHAFVQVRGEAIKVSADVVREEFRRGGVLQQMLLRYLHFSSVQISQSAACNRLHDLEERMSRWLLMVHDRLQVTPFLLTHEFLAQMLGTRRSSVTLAAGTLQRAGLIEYHRGQIHIPNRDALEQSTCECYGIIKKSWDGLLNNDNLHHSTN